MPDGSKWIGTTPRRYARAVPWETGVRACLAGEGAVAATQYPSPTVSTVWPTGSASCQVADGWFQGLPGNQPTFSSPLCVKWRREWSPGHAKEHTHQDSRRLAWGTGRAPRRATSKSRRGEGGVAHRARGGRPGNVDGSPSGRGSVGRDGLPVRLPAAISLSPRSGGPVWLNWRDARPKMQWRGSSERAHHWHVDVLGRHDQVPRTPLWLPPRSARLCMPGDHLPDFDQCLAARSEVSEQRGEERTLGMSLTSHSQPLEGWLPWLLAQACRGSPAPPRLASAAVVEPRASLNGRRVALCEMVCPRPPLLLPAQGARPDTTARLPPTWLG